MKFDEIQDPKYQGPGSKFKQRPEYSIWLQTAQEV